MASRKHTILLRQRLLALTAAAVTLWTAAITAGSKTLSAAAASLREELSSPMTLLRWELADLWPDDGLSHAAVMVLGESPILLSARAQVTTLWSRESGDDIPAADPPPEITDVTEPVRETPVVSPPAPTTTPENDLISPTTESRHEHWCPPIPPAIPSAGGYTSATPPATHWIWKR